MQCPFCGSELMVRERYLGGSAYMPISDELKAQPEARRLAGRSDLQVVCPNYPGLCGFDASSHYRVTDSYQVSPLDGEAFGVETSTSGGGELDQPV